MNGCSVMHIRAILVHAKDENKTGDGACECFNVAMLAMSLFNVIIRYMHTTGKKDNSVNKKENRFVGSGKCESTNDLLLFLFMSSKYYLFLPFLFFDKDFVEKQNSNY